MVLDWRQSGSFIPFPLPLDTEELALPYIDTGQQVKLCFNEQYLPLVLGALKVLTRDETYQGTEETKIFAVQQCTQLLDRFSDGCPENDLQMPTWKFWPVLGQGDHIEWTVLHDELETHVASTAWGAFLQYTGELTDNSGNWAGGKLQRLHFQSAGSSDLISVIGHDCADGLFVFNFVGSFNLVDIGSNLAIKDLTITSTDVGWFYVETTANYDCTEV